METILEFLSNDHRACDDVFAAAEVEAGQQHWERARTQFEDFRAAMARHFAMEEDVLFPAFESRTGMTSGPTEVMRMEHAQMRDLIDEMAAAVAASDRDRYLGLAETLNMLMQQHNLKEENMLYPMSDRALATDRDAIVQAMAAVSR